MANMPCFWAMATNPCRAPLRARRCCMFFSWMVPTLKVAGRGATQRLWLMPGLSMPRWEDIDGNGTADVAYAGDLKGNLWKFDLQSDRPNEWQVALKEGTV